MIIYKCSNFPRSDPFTTCARLVGIGGC